MAQWAATTTCTRVMAQWAVTRNECRAATEGPVGRGGRANGARDLQPRSRRQPLCTPGARGGGPSVHRAASAGPVTRATTNARDLLDAHARGAGRARASEDAARRPARRATAIRVAARTRRGAGRARASEDAA